MWVDEPVIVVILAAGTVCKEGKVAVCVTKAAVGSRASC